MNVKKVHFLLYFSAFFHIFSHGTEPTYYKKWIEHNSCSLTINDLPGSNPTEIQEIVLYLQDPYNQPGKRGYIFHGPPGTGKSTFARAIAGTVNGICLSISGSDFEGSYTGTGPERIEQLFKRAYELALYCPVVLFIDEIEAVGTRSASEVNGTQYEIRTLDKLITEISAIPENTPLVVIGATNHEAKLDPALIRAGRCKLVEVLLPDVISRRAIITYYLDKHELDVPVLYKEQLVVKTHGFNHAALKDLIVTMAKRCNKTFQYPIAQSTLQETIAQHKKIKHIAQEKELREKRREALEIANLASARIGWWSSALTITAITAGVLGKIIDWEQISKNFYR